MQYWWIKWEKIHPLFLPRNSDMLLLFHSESNYNSSKSIVNDDNISKNTAIVWIRAKRTVRQYLLSPLQIASSAAVPHLISFSNYFQRREAGGGLDTPARLCPPSLPLPPRALPKAFVTGLSTSSSDSCSSSSQALAGRSSNSSAHLSNSFLILLTLPCLILPDPGSSHARSESQMNSFVSWNMTSRSLLNFKAGSVGLWWRPLLWVHQDLSFVWTCLARSCLC